jgi:hypothetical protein
MRGDDESVEWNRNECRSISEFGLELVESLRRELATSSSLESSGRDRVYGHLRGIVPHLLSTPRSTSRDADLPPARLELDLFLFCLGLFKSALKLRPTSIPMREPIANISIPR